MAASHLLARDTSLPLFQGWKLRTFCSQFPASPMPFPFFLTWLREEVNHSIPRYISCTISVPPETDRIPLLSHFPVIAFLLPAISIRKCLSCSRGVFPKLMLKALKLKLSSKTVCLSLSTSNLSFHLLSLRTIRATHSQLWLCSGSSFSTIFKIKKIDRWERVFFPLFFL